MARAAKSAVLPLPLRVNGFFNAHTILSNNHLKHIVCFVFAVIRIAVVQNNHIRILLNRAAIA